MQQDQTVQWFPGHMARTRRLIKESLPLVDAVTELLDARVPESSRNPELLGMIGDKPHIVLLNKCDLADERATRAWVRHFSAFGAAALPVDCRSGKGLQAYGPLVRDVLAERIRINNEKGMIGRPLRVMVVGIPNTGKSSFINRMAGKRRAEVADKPGVTRQNRWFAIGGGIELLDTPGVLWPKFDDPAVGDKLAFIGSVKGEILDSEVMAVRLLDVLKADYADRIRTRYGVLPQPEDESWTLLEQIGVKRGMRIRGGEVDTERAANMLLDEYRGGKLGRITLERPME